MEVSHSLLFLCVVWSYAGLPAKQSPLATLKSLLNFGLVRCATLILWKIIIGKIPLQLGRIIKQTQYIISSWPVKNIHSTSQLLEWPSYDDLCTRSTYFGYGQGNTSHCIPHDAIIKLFIHALGYTSRHISRTLEGDWVSIVHVRMGSQQKSRVVRCSLGWYSWWRHQMETFSALLTLGAGNSPVNSPQKGQWRGALMFPLICAWTTGEQTMVRLAIWDAIAPIMTSL